MFHFSPEISMSQEEFRLLRDLVYQHCGLHFSEDSKYILEKRLGKRLQQHQIKNYKDYYYLLRYSKNKEEELSEVVDLLTTNETYFFREDYQLKTFISEIVPEICERKEKLGDRTLKIWSAGCSSGEEPYTLAMMLMEIPSLRGWKVSIVGTDICQSVLRTARKGVYGDSSFRATDETIRRRYFSAQDGKYRVSDSVKELVSISHLNLLDSSRIVLLGTMDVIFCRNVIIYFDLVAKKRVIESFYNRLRPGGYLLLGHSESLMNITTAFELRHFSHDMVYQRPSLGVGL